MKKEEPMEPHEPKEEPEKKEVCWAKEVETAPPIPTMRDVLLAQQKERRDRAYIHQIAPIRAYYGKLKLL